MIYVVKDSDRAGNGYRAVSESGWRGPLRASHSMATSDAAKRQQEVVEAAEMLARNTVANR